MTLDQQGAVLITAIVSVVVGAFVGGGTVLIVADRLVKNVLGSPLLLHNAQALAESWPAPVQSFLHDAGELAVGITTPPDSSPPPADGSVITTTTVTPAPPAA